MTNDYKENEEIIIVEESLQADENDEFDGYEESSPAEEITFYEETEDYDEYDGYEEALELNEISENEIWDESDEEDGYDDSFEPEDLFSTAETVKKSYKGRWIVGICAAAILLLAVVLLVTIGSDSIKKMNFFNTPEEENKVTLMDLGVELGRLERLSTDKLEAILEVQKVRTEEARKKAIEDSFKFDEVEGKKELINVSLQLTSMLKDLKIKVVNDNKKLIANVPFVVEVKDPNGTVTTFTDENKDGIIYLEGLKGGNYSVKTLSLKGYEDKYSFAEKTDTIDVKETLEYKKVDVSNEVKSDKDVDSRKEDPGAQKPVQPREDEPEKDPQPDASGNNPTPSSEAVFGIDVSKWNGNIDWSSVAASGVSYAIIRCGFRGSTEGGLIEDSMFWSNIGGAGANGIKVGVYFFSQAVNEVEAVEEASMVLDMVRGYNISYPIFLDVETSGGGRGDQIGVAERTAVCRAFCETIRNSGYTPGIYSNKTWFEEKINTSELTSYKIWLAQYSKEVTYGRTRYDIWQYSDSGNVLGISTGVDLNMSYLGY